MTTPNHHWERGLIDTTGQNPRPRKAMMKFDSPVALQETILESLAYQEPATDQLADLLLAKPNAARLRNISLGHTREISIGSSVRRTFSYSV